MAQGLPMVGALIVFMYVFTMVKGNITAFVPFSWDQTLDRLDTALHFGFRPWQILQPILGYWPITFILNFNYNLWFFVMNAFWVHYAFFARPGVARTRYFTAFMLTWIVGGGLMAVCFSSAGPCYFEHSASRPILTRRSWIISTVSTRSCRSGPSIPRRCCGTSALMVRPSADISAMPSMHSANALLFVLAAWNGPRLLGTCSSPIAR